MFNNLKLKFQLRDRVARFEAGEGAVHVRDRDELEKRWGKAVIAVHIEMILLVHLKLFLPKNGLDAIRSILEGEGFYFENYSDNYVAALFPKGWSIERSDNLPKEVGIAYLVGPSGRRRAKLILDKKLKARLEVM